MKAGEAVRELATTPGEVTGQTPNLPIPQVVGQLYECAPPAARSRLLEHLLSPLGALSLVVVANGIFADLRFRSGWQNLHIQLEDLQNVHATDVIALVDHVQQVSLESIYAMARLLSTAPGMAGTATAALLATLLVQCAPGRCAADEALVN